MKLCNYTLRKMRIHYSLSQEQMADNMNISQASYNRLETGKTKIKVEHLALLADIYNLSLNEVWRKLSNPEVN